MKVFVTGGTGLLGGNLIPELLAQGCSVRALVRSLVKGCTVLDQRVELIRGDMLSMESWAPALEGCQALVHAGAHFSAYSKSAKHNALAERTNVQATISLLEAAHGVGVRNTVYVSSAGVLSPRAGSPLDENSPHDPCPGNQYFASKIRAERAIGEFMRSRPKMRVVMILPAAMLGPGDWGPTPLGHMVTSFIHGEIKAILPGAMALVDARDVARGMVRALEQGDSGECFILGGRTYAFAEIMATLAKVSGLPEPAKKPPWPVLMMVARIMALAAKITGKPPALTTKNLKRLSLKLSFDSSKAEKILGVRFRPLEETLADTVAWFQEKEGRQLNRVPMEAAMSPQA